MGHVAQFGDRVHGAQDVGDVRHGDHFGARANQGGGVLHIQASLRIDTDIAHQRPGAARDLLPGHDIAVVFELREHNFIALSQGAAVPRHRRRD